MLTDTKLKNLKPRNKPYKLSDSEGLYIEVQPNGSKLWRLKYRYHGKEKRNFDYERTRKEKEMAVKLEMENQARRGELIEAQEVEDALIEFVTLSKNKLLGLKTRIVKVVMACAEVSISHENQKKISAGVDEEVRSALSELSGLDKWGTKPGA